MFFVITICLFTLKYNKQVTLGWFIRYFNVMFLYFHVVSTYPTLPGIGCSAIHTWRFQYFTPTSLTNTNHIFPVCLYYSTYFTKETSFVLYQPNSWFHLLLVKQAMLYQPGLCSFIRHKNICQQRPHILKLFFFVLNLYVNVYVYSLISHRVQQISQFTPLVLELSLILSISSGENSAHFLQLLPLTILHCSFHQVPITAGWTEAA